MAKSNELSLVLIEYFDSRWLELYSHVLSTRFCTQNVGLIDVSKFQRPSKRPLLRNPTRDLFQSYGSKSLGRDRTGCKGHNCKFTPSILDSEMVTVFSDEEPSGLLHRWLLGVKTRASHDFYHSFKEYCMTTKPVEIVISNGRLGLQQAAVLVADELNIKKSFLESWKLSVPERESRVFRQDFSPHNRFKVQQKAIENNLLLDEFDADEYLRRRSDPSGGNQFGKKWENYSANNTLQSSRTNLMLTTSTDEYVALGPEWKAHDWIDQYDAFDHVISALRRDPAQEFILRIHPNLARKNFRSVAREYSRVFWLKKRHPGLQVIGPLSEINTYNLIASSERVFASLSLAGLESSVMGKSTWCTMPNNYDIVSDVRSLHRREQVNMKHLSPWEVDTKRSSLALLTDWYVSEKLTGKRASRYPEHTLLDSLTSTSLRGLHIRSLLTLQRISNKLLVRFIIQVNDSRLSKTT